MDIQAVILIIVLPIVLGVAANLLTPKVSDWIGRRYSNFRSRTVKQLNEEIAYITKLHKSPEKVMSTFLGYVLILVIFLSLFILCGFVIIITLLISPEKTFTLGLATVAGVGLFVLGIMAQVSLRAFDILSELASFDEYVEKTQKHIQELEQRNKSV